MIYFKSYFKSLSNDILYDIVAEDSSNQSIAAAYRTADESVRSRKDYVIYALYASTALKDTSMSSRFQMRQRQLLSITSKPFRACEDCFHNAQP